MKKSATKKTTAKKSTAKKASKKKAVSKKTVMKKAASKKAGAKAPVVKSPTAKSGGNGSKLIDQKVQELADWRGQTLSQIRNIIKSADSEVIEEVKWRGVPVWSVAGIICTGETYKNVVKMTFMKGAALKDPAKLFNSSLEGNARRAIDIKEGEKINEKALKALVSEAITLNKSKTK